MVSFKGKTTSVRGFHILEEHRASSNSKDFKIYSGARKSCVVDSSRKSTARIPMAAPRQSAPAANVASAKPTQTGLNRGKVTVGNLENQMTGKCDTSAKLRTQRKALADMSNVNHGSRVQLRSRLSSGPKLMEGKTDTSNSLQGRKTSNTKNPYRLRVSLTKSIVLADSVSRKSIMEKVKNEDNMMGKCDSSGTHVVGRAGRKAMADMSNANKGGSFQLRNRFSGPKLMKDKITASNSSQSKTNGGRNSYGLRNSLTTSIMIPNASSRKLIQTKSTVKSTSVVNHILEKKKYFSIDRSVSKEKVTSNSDSEDGASVLSNGYAPEQVQCDAGCCSTDNVTIVISRPRCQRRRSFTLSLMARSEKEELPSIDDNSNPLEVSEYVDDIYQYYWTTEVENPLLADYMTAQSEITPRMRGILINWLIEVHFKYELMQETLFLMVDLLDRVLSLVTIRKKELQLVGLTALLLASKYEDFWHPKIDELISISANLYTRDQILSMEKLILSKLRFRLNIPTPYVFMLRFLKAAQSEKKLENLAFYLIELSLVEYEALKFKPSLLCASAIYVARCTLQVTPAWTELLRGHARYEKSQLRTCADMILGFQRAAGQGLAKVTYEKFLRPDRCCVAAIKPLDKLPL